MDLRLTTANLHDWGKPPVDPGRQDRLRAAIQAAEPDVLCVQEFWHEEHDAHDHDAHDEDVDDTGAGGGRERVFARFAGELEMQGLLAPARSCCHVGVLWRPEVARLLAWQEYSRWGFHHALAVATLDVGAAAPLRVASTQLHPADPQARFTEAGLVAMAGLGDPAQPTLLGADFNAAGREAALPGQTGRFYDPEPYVGRPRGRHQQFQAIWDDDPDAEPLLDRRALERLRRAGLVDVAHHHQVPWRRTSGHHRADPHGDRRPDAWRGSAAALELVTGHQVNESADSDHARVTISIDPERLDPERLDPDRLPGPAGAP